MQKRVLLIEDEPMLRENIKLILRLHDFDVVDCANGVLAVEQLENYLPDIIISDIKMPEMNGYELIEYVRNNPKLLKVPFIFVSAKIDRSEVREGMDSGADDYITKPFKAEELIRAINTRIARMEDLVDIAGSDNLALESLAEYEKLTKTEKRILACIREGKESKEIAAQFFVSLKTVENHRFNITKKLNLRGNNAIFKYFSQYPSKSLKIA